MKERCLKSRDRTWIGSVQRAVATWSRWESRMLINDQVATAPCTDPIQERALCARKLMTSEHR